MTRERAIQMAAKCDEKADALTDIAKKLQRLGVLQEIAGPTMDAAGQLYTCAEDYRQFVRDDTADLTAERADGAVTREALEDLRGAYHRLAAINERLRGALTRALAAAAPSPADDVCSRCKRPRRVGADGLACLYTGGPYCVPREEPSPPAVPALENSGVADLMAALKTALDPRPTPPPAVPEKCGAPDYLTYPMPCPDCGAPWVMFHGGDDAGLVHGPFCPRLGTGRAPTGGGR